MLLLQPSPHLFLCPSLTQEAEVLWHLLLTVQISKIFLKYPHPWKTYSEYTLVEAELVSSNLHIDLNHLLVLVIFKKLVYMVPAFVGLLIVQAGFVSGLMQF